jgi:DNA-binding XRE family transcriptional regulator
MASTVRRPAPAPFAPINVDAALAITPSDPNGYAPLPDDPMKLGTGAGAERSLAQRKYQLLLAVPQSDRPDHLQTRADVAEALGVDEATVMAWEASAGWWDETFGLARALVGHQLADILQATVKSALKGSVAAQKLAYTVLGVAAEKVEHKLELENDQLVIVMRGPAPAQPQPTTPAPSELPSGT